MDTIIDATTYDEPTQFVKLLNGRIEDHCYPERPITLSFPEVPIHPDFEDFVVFQMRTSFLSEGAMLGDNRIKLSEDAAVEMILKARCLNMVVKYNSKQNTIDFCFKADFKQKFSSPSENRQSWLCKAFVRRMKGINMDVIELLIRKIDQPVVTMEHVKNHILRVVKHHEPNSPYIAVEIITHDGSRFVGNSFLGNANNPNDEIGYQTAYNRAIDQLFMVLFSAERMQKYEAARRGILIDASRTNNRDPENGSIPIMAGLTLRS